MLIIVKISHIFNMGFLVIRISIHMAQIEVKLFKIPMKINKKKTN